MKNDPSPSGWTTITKEEYARLKNDGVKEISYEESNKIVDKNSKKKKQSKKKGSLSKYMPEIKAGGKVKIKNRPGATGEVLGVSMEDSFGETAPYAEVKFDDDGQVVPFPVDQLEVDGWKSETFEDRAKKEKKNGWRTGFLEEKDPFQKSTILEHMLATNLTEQELQDVFEVAKGLPNESKLMWAISQKPNVGDLKEHALDRRQELDDVDEDLKSPMEQEEDEAAASYKEPAPSETIDQEHEQRVEKAILKTAISEKEAKERLAEMFGIKKKAKTKAQEVLSPKKEEDEISPKAKASAKLKREQAFIEAHTFKGKEIPIGDFVGINKKHKSLTTGTKYQVIGYDHNGQLILMKNRGSQQSLLKVVVPKELIRIVEKGKRRLAMEKKAAEKEIALKWLEENKPKEKTTIDGGVKIQNTKKALEFFKKKINKAPKSLFGKEDAKSKKKVEKFVEEEVEVPGVVAPEKVKTDTAVPGVSKAKEVFGKKKVKVTVTKINARYEYA